MTQTSLRNISFVGHPSAGKTTLVDHLAFLCGATPRIGKVADKTSLCDTEPEEQEKQHTLTLSVVHAEHEGKRWSLIDTPGYPDFMAQTLSGMFASDLVVGVVSATSGVTFNLRKKLEAAKQLGRGRAIVITHLDAENTDFDALIAELRGAIGEVCVPIRLPNASGPGFSEVRRVRTDETSEWRQRLFDRIMDACEDEDLVMEYLETQKVTEEQLEDLMPSAVAKGSLVPVLLCNPAAELGVKEVLSFFTRFAPSPCLTELKNEDGEVVPVTEDGPLLGTVFSVSADPHVGKVCLARLIRGKVTAHESVHGTAHPDESEKMGGLFFPVGGKKRDAIESATAGDIVAFSKVEKIGVGESFTASGQELTKIVTPSVPEPMMALAIVPRSRADEQKIGEALHKLEAEDPTFRIGHDAETHELVAHGMSDLHLQIVEAMLKRRFNVEIDKHLPKVPLRETITKAAEGHHRHKKQSGGKGQFGECYLRMKPLSEGEGFVFKDAVVGGSIPRNLIPAVEKGIREQIEKGVLVHSKVVDVEVELYDGKFHAVDSDEASFKAAGARAFREAFAKAGPVLLEPTVELEIHVPTSDAGAIFSDITSQRRGHVMDQWTESDGAITVIKAEAPLSMVQTYNRDLKSQTSGEGYYVQEKKGFSRMPAAEQKRVLADAALDHGDD